MAIPLAAIAATSRAVASTSKRTAKVAALAELLRRCDPADAPAVVGLLTGQPRQGRIGVGWSNLQQLDPDIARDVTIDRMSVADLDAALTDIAALHGPGSQRARAEALQRIAVATDGDERDFVRRVLGGELRQGANAGVVTDAIARASGLALADVRRAAMLLGDLGATAAKALAGETMESIGLTTLVGVQPMLAATAASVTEALSETGAASVEWKLDGARVQVHRRGDEVRVYTRTLHEISARVPEIVTIARALPGDDVVLDGEALGLDGDGNPLAFQDSMQATTRLRPFFFDALHVGGESLIDRSLRDRKAILRDLVPASLLMPTIDVGPDDDPAVAERFAADAVAAGHEGVMVKALESVYAAGRRGSAWRKVKPVYSLDLVVLAAEWGYGRRTGWLSNIHLGARGDDGSFVMVGKTFKGMTDELLAWQTEQFLQREIGREGHVVHIRPDMVVEIAVDGVQRSTRYPGGVALRFARVKRYRPDKSPSAADAIDGVQALL